MIRYTTVFRCRNKAAAVLGMDRSQSKNTFSVWNISSPRSFFCSHIALTSGMQAKIFSERGASEVSR